MTDFTTKVQADFNKEFSEFANKITNMKQFMNRDVREAIKKEITLNYRRQGRPLKWTPLAKSTILSRKRRGTYGRRFTAGPILVEYGVQFISALNSVFRGLATDTYFRADFKSGSAKVDKIAAIHQGDLIFGKMRHFEMDQNVRKYTRHVHTMSGIKEVTVKAHKRHLSINMPTRPHFGVVERTFKRDILNRMAKFIKVHK